jgi:hypothetical protein
VKIDAFCHIMPGPYYDRFFQLDATEHSANLRKRVSGIPCLAGMDVRFAQMDEFGDYRQIINIAAPPAEDLGSPEISREMSRIGNESMAELVRAARLGRAPAASGRAGTSSAPARRRSSRKTSPDTRSPSGRSTTSG